MHEYAGLTVASCNIFHLAAEKDASVTSRAKEKGSLKARRSLLVRGKAEGTLVTSAKQHKLASD